MQDSINYGTHPTKWEDVKICTYAICKNELKFVDDWLENIWDYGHGSDYICVLDTGSTDGTFERLRAKGNSLGIPEDHLILEQREIKPWRFDVARNESMKLIPSPELVDYCYCIDLDELIISDFWTDLRKKVFEHPDAQRIFYRYAWSHDEISGEPKLVFLYDKTHGPVGWKWFSPCHERLSLDPSCASAYSDKSYALDNSKIYLHHYPDQTKSRGSYLELLELRAKEEPDDLYGLYYLSREYTFRNQFTKALEVATLLYGRLAQKFPDSNESSVLDDMLMLPNVCLLMAESFSVLGIKKDEEFYYRRALDYDPTLREGYIKLAQYYGYSGEVEKGFATLDEMNKKSVYHEDWRLQPYTWRSWKEHQIRGDLYSWDCHYDLALAEFEEGAKDIKTSSDISEATAHNFYNDWEFCKKKYSELEAFSKSVNLREFVPTSFDLSIDAAVTANNIAHDPEMALSFFKTAYAFAVSEGDEDKKRFALTRISHLTATASSNN